MLTHHDLILPNGLKVVLVPQPAVHRAVASLYLRVGSRFESKENNGISHFLEHMVFRGTPSMKTAHDQALAFERLGGTLYAATHVDHGVMSVGVPPKNLEPVLALLGEVAIAPLFTEIEIERGIVREEILEDLDDDGRDVDADNLARALARAGDTLPTRRHAPRCALACAGDDEHTLGLSLAELCVREVGWSPLWLGRRTPLAEVVRLVTEGDVDVVSLCASEASRDAQALADIDAELGAACHAHGAGLVLGGAGSWPALPRHGVRLTSFAAFRELLVSREVAP